MRDLWRISMRRELLEELILMTAPAFFLLSLLFPSFTLDPVFPLGYCIPSGHGDRFYFRWIHTRRSVTVPCQAHARAQKSPAWTRSFFVQRGGGAGFKKIRITRMIVRRDHTWGAGSPNFFLSCSFFDVTYDDCE